MAFVSVMLVPIAYYLLIPTWLHRSWLPRFQFWGGVAVYIFCGPFINIFVLVYATIYMDSFGWGKTRKVIKEKDSEVVESELERIARGDKGAQMEAPSTRTETSANSSEPDVIAAAVQGPVQQRDVAQVV